MKGEGIFATFRTLRGLTLVDCGNIFFLLIINDYVFVQNNIGSQVEDLSENLSTNKTSLLVHLKFCCP